MRKAILCMGLVLAASSSFATSSQPLFSAPLTSFPQTIVSELSNAPNPVDTRKPGIEGQTLISYHLSENLPVTITLYDLFGVKVKSWNFAAGAEGGREGINQFMWDGCNQEGQHVSKGGYIAQLEIDTPNASVTAVRKIGVIH